MGAKERGASGLETAFRLAYERRTATVSIHPPELERQEARLKFSGQRVDYHGMNALDRIFRVPFKDERGFTLPEVLTTVLILGILLSIATASWFGVIESRRVDSAANQLAADLRLAHTNATNQLTEWRLVFRKDGNAIPACSNADYCLVKVTGPSSTENTPRNFPEGTRISDANIAFDNSGILGTLFGPSISGETMTIKFKPDGKAEAQLTGLSSRPEIEVGPEGGGGTKKIELVKETSRVSIVP